MVTRVFSGLRRDERALRFPSPEAIAEEVRLQGYSIVEDWFSDADRASLSSEIDRLYADELQANGAAALRSINDLGVVRSPFLRSKAVLENVFDDRVVTLVEHILGARGAILHVNRAVINAPGEVHPATSWHREPPYQNFTTSTPLALTLLHVIDESSSETGGVAMLSGSHQWSTFPTDCYVARNARTPRIPAGSLLIFDSALFHCGTENISTGARRSIVTIFTSPLIKQQTVLATEVQRHPDVWQFVEKKKLQFIIGVDTNPQDDDQTYRAQKIRQAKPIY